MVRVFGSIFKNRNASAGVYGAKVNFGLVGGRIHPSQMKLAQCTISFLGTAPNIAMTNAVQQVVGGEPIRTGFDNGQKVSLRHYQDAAFGNTPNTGDTDTDDLITALVTALTNMNLIGV